MGQERLHPEDYVFVGSPGLLKKNPLTKSEHAQRHTLVDAHGELPLFRYWRDAPRGGDRLRFAKVRIMGTISAIRALVLAQKGVAVLPHFLVRNDLKTKRLVRVFPEVPLRSDYYRLIYRGDDPHRTTYQRIAKTFLEVPLP